MNKWQAKKDKKRIIIDEFPSIPQSSIEQTRVSVDEIASFYGLKWDDEKKTYVERRE